MMRTKNKPKGDNSNTEKYLEHKNMKTWVDGNSGAVCFTLYARALYIAWSSSPEYWAWDCFKETRDDNIEVAKLKAVCFLDVRGKFKASNLSVGVTYEIIVVVKLAKGAFGWEFPINLKLSLPDGTIQERQLCLLEQPKGQWIELKVGSFLLSQDYKDEEVCFDLYEHCQHWKSGLIVREASFLPKK